MAAGLIPMKPPEPCPHLPPIDRPWPAAALSGLAPLGPNAGDFYLTSLRCAQSRWLAGLPAQSILMLNRAFSCDLDEENPLLVQSPWPYAALAWILENAASPGFLGNPRRHFQHLATRMNNSPLRDLRIARAWACWAITGIIRPEFPDDDAQLAEEDILLPTPATIAGLPVWNSRPIERANWQNLLLAHRPR